MIVARSKKPCVQPPSPVVKLTKVLVLPSHALSNVLPPFPDMFPDMFPDAGLPPLLLAMATIAQPLSTGAVGWGVGEGNVMSLHEIGKYAGFSPEFAAEGRISLHATQSPPEPAEASQYWTEIALGYRVAGLLPPAGLSASANTSTAGSAGEARVYSMLPPQFIFD